MNSNFYGVAELPAHGVLHGALRKGFFGCPGFLWFPNEFKRISYPVSPERKTHGIRSVNSGKEREIRKWPDKTMSEIMVSLQPYPGTSNETELIHRGVFIGPPPEPRSRFILSAELFCMKGIMDSKGVLETKAEKNVETPV